MNRNTLRDYIVANLMDGREDGTITMKASALADEIVEIVGFAILNALGLEDWAESYYNPHMGAGR